MFFSKIDPKFNRLLIKIFFIVGVLLFKIILDLYFEIYGPLFEYLGLRYSPQSAVVRVLVYIILLVLASILPLNYQKPSNIFLLFLFLMSYVPVTVIFSYDVTASVFGFLFYTLFMYTLSLLDKVRFGSNNLVLKSFSAKPFNRLLLIMIVICLVVLVSHYGLKINVKSYDTIYDVRANFKDLTQGSRLLAFSFGWLANVFTIVLLTVSFVKKKWVMVGVAFLIQFYLFNLGGNKSVFMLPIFLLFIILSLKYFKEYSSLFILYSLVFMSFGLYFYDFVINDKFSLISSIFVRRNFYVPANLYFRYIDFFEFRPNDFFAKSYPFSLFIESYYVNEIPEMIGERYIANGTHANGNFLADLYYNFKWFGFLIGFIFVYGYFYIIDSIVKNKNYLIIVPIASVPVITMMNSGLIVNIISFGLFMIIILLTLYPTHRFLHEK